MTVATCVCCSMISATQTRYGVRGCCHGRSWRPCASNQASSGAAIESGAASAIRAARSVEQIGQTLLQFLVEFVSQLVAGLVAKFLRQLVGQFFLQLLFLFLHFLLQLRLLILQVLPCQRL